MSDQWSLLDFYLQQRQTLITQTFYFILYLHPSLPPTKIFSLSHTSGLSMFSLIHLRSVMCQFLALVGKNRKCMICWLSREKGSLLSWKECHLYTGKCLVCSWALIKSDFTMSKFQTGILSEFHFPVGKLMKCWSWGRWLKMFQKPLEAMGLNLLAT